MELTLEQKVLYTTYQFLVDDSGVQKTTISLGKESEYHIPFEQITTNKTIIKENKRGLLIGGCCFILAGIIYLISAISDGKLDLSILLVWLIPGAFMLCVYFFTGHEKLYLYTSNNSAIKIFNDKPNKSVVNEFINEIFKRRNEYLLAKYGQPTKNLAYSTQLDNFNWLLNIRVLSLDEYNQKISTLNGLFNNTPGKDSIGFAAR